MDVVLNLNVMRLLWLREHPDDPTLLEYADEAKRFLRHGDKNDLLPVRDELCNLLTDDYGVDPAAAAGYAMVATLNTCLDDEAIEVEGASDRDVDPETWDTAFLGSIAWSGGPPWNGLSDPRKRRAFWNWYLSAVCEVRDDEMRIQRGGADPFQHRGALKASKLILPRVRRLNAAGDARELILTIDDELAVSGKTLKCKFTIVEPATTDEDALALIRWCVLRDLLADEYSTQVMCCEFHSMTSGRTYTTRY